MTLLNQMYFIHTLQRDLIKWYNQLFEFKFFIVNIHFV